MSLLAYNKTTAILPLPAGSPTVSLAASQFAGQRGRGNNATAELEPNLAVDPINGSAGGLTVAQFALLQDLQQSTVLGALLLGNLTISDADVPFIPPIIVGGGAGFINNVLPQSGYAKIDSEYIHWASSFYAQVNLSVAALPGDTTLTFASTAAFASAGFALISTSGGNELVSWTSKSGTQLLGVTRNLRGTSNGGATAAIATPVIACYVSGVTRGQLGSTAATHADAAALVIAPLAEFEWTALEEFRTASLVVNAGGDLMPQMDVQTFADLSLGSDLNLGKAPGAGAVSSLKRLANLIPGSWRRSNIGFLSNAVYGWPEFNFEMIGGPMGAGASPFALVGGAPTVVAGPFTVASINADSSLEVSGAFTADQFFGGAAAGQANAIRVLSGPLKGQTRMCAGNTTTALLPRNPLTGIQVGDVVQLETRSTTIQIPSGVNAVVAFTPYMGFKGIKLQALAGAVGFAVTDGAIVAMESCTINLSTAGSLLLARNATLLTNPNAWILGGMATNSPFSALRQDGVFIDSRAAAAFGVFALEGSRLDATCLVRNADINAITNSTVLAGAISHGRNSSLRAAFNVSAEAAGPSAAARALWIGKHATAPTAWGSYDNSRLGLNNIMILGSTLGVQVGSHTLSGFPNLGAQAALGLVSGDTSADVTTAQAYVPTAAANSGVGVKYQAGSRVMFDVNAAATRISGTGGDTEGRRAALDNKLWTSLRVADADGIKGYTDPYGNRIETQV